MRHVKGDLNMKAIFKIDAEKKHSRRYETTDEKFPIKTIYVHRSFADGKDKLTLTIEEETTSK